ncbi:hypothetical protein MBLNU459_g5401t1 [Dothideomycetes sp. NU459]
MPSFYTLLPVLGATLPVTHAWGTLGHETVAYIAQNFVTSATKSWAQGILDDTTTSYLANVATWADTYRYTSAGSWSAPFHFIDAEDSPPTSCSVDYSRDCGSTGCVVSALANYTKRVTSTSLSDSEVETALKFITHFVGDIHQPLHDEALEIGGNDVDVTFDGASTNLHHIWDTNMPETLRGGYTLADAKAWATNLTTEIKSGTYKSEAASWISDIDVSDVVTTTMTWATQANSYVCTVVMPNGYKVLESGDLDGDYYASAIPTIELQIARAGYRLAAFLDAIYAGSSSKRSVGEIVEREAEEDLSGAEFLPAARPLSKAKLARAAHGYGCKH